MRKKKKINLRLKPQVDAVEAPAIVTPMHVQDRVLSAAAGAAKGYRRIDRLQWLADHGDIGAHQLHAGRRLQRDWQIAKIEAGPRSLAGGGGGSGIMGSLPDAVLDAGQRVRRAMAVLPAELETLTTLFLLPEDHPFSLERCAALVKQDRRAAAFGIRVSLSLLARHYGFEGGAPKAHEMVRGTISSLQTPRAQASGRKGPEGRTPRAQASGRNGDER